MGVCVRVVLVMVVKGAINGPIMPVLAMRVLMKGVWDFIVSAADWRDGVDVISVWIGMMEPFLALLATASNFSILRPRM